MHILNNGRLTFLNYLRNLPSQGVILSFVIISGFKLEPKLFYWENTQATINFICFVTMFIFAIYGNTSIFMEDYLATYNQRINDESVRQTKKGVKGFRHLWALLRFSWHNERPIFFELIIVYVVVQYGLVVVLMSAIGAAKAFLNLKILH